MTPPQQRCINGIAFQLGQLVRHATQEAVESSLQHRGRDLCFDMTLAIIEDSIRRYRDETRQKLVLVDPEDATNDDEL